MVGAYVRVLYCKESRDPWVTLTYNWTLETPAISPDKPLSSSQIAEINYIELTHILQPLQSRKLSCMRVMGVRFQRYIS